jgi:HTH-type transcriptional regulator / antitoxin HigA
MEHVKPIRTDEDHAEAIAEIERLWSAEPGTIEHDRLEVLGMLVDTYEAARWPIEAPDPVEAIKSRMEQNGYSQSDLGRLLGSRSRASEVLARKRKLTVEMIHKLTNEWHIPAEVLIKPYRMEKPTPKRTHAA